MKIKLFISKESSNKNNLIISVRIHCCAYLTLLLTYLKNKLTI